MNVELAAEWQKGGERHAARALDLSHGGCFLETRSSPEPGERVRVTIHLSTVAALTTLVEVRHRTPTGFGARFVDQTDEQRTILAKAWTDLVRAARTK
jgi:hypothetical protein